MGGVPADDVRYTTARIALVGDSMVGKTHLGHRIATGSWRAYPSTHGQQFWVVDELGGVRKDGVICEAVLWDFAGQPDYRIIHSLFLEDLDLALLLFDPSERSHPLKGVEHWHRELGTARSSGVPCRKLLVGTKSDRGAPSLGEDELIRFCDDHGIEGYLTTSALENEGIDDLRTRVRDLIAWEERTATITTRTFKRVKDFVLGLKEVATAERGVVAPDELRNLLKVSDPDWEFSAGQMMTAVGHLETHGFITLLRTTAGEPRILLRPDLLVNLAASMILAARRDPQRHGSLIESEVLGGELELPELEPLDEAQRRVVLDAGVALFVRRNVCFRETDERRALLVFPSLINQLPPPPREDLAVREGSAYHITGAVQNVYAAMVVLLGYSGLFTRVDQWRDLARFRLGREEICGIRAEHPHEGELELTLHFGEGAPKPTRTLFEGLLERLLMRRRGIEVIKYPAVLCPECHETQSRRRVRQRIDGDKRFLWCDDCEEVRVPLPSSTSLLGVVGREERAIDIGQARAGARTAYETALVHLKRIASEVRGEAPRPTCFLSYAWGDPCHEAWVEGLAQDLRNGGVDVRFDRWDADPGSSITEYVEGMATMDFAVVVGTPQLLNKYREGDAVVAEELRLAGRRLREGHPVVPLLATGEPAEAFPEFLRDRVCVDLREEHHYFHRLLDVVAQIQGIPADHPGLVDLRRDLAQRPG